MSDWSSDVCSSDLPHALDIVEGGDKSDRFQNWRRPGLELVRRGSIFDVIAAEGCDHLAAAEHRWHAFEPAGLGIESPDTRRPIKLVTGERIEIDVERRNVDRSEEHTSELQSLMRISYAVFCLKKKKQTIYTRKSSTTTSHNTT